MSRLVDYIDSMSAPRKKKKATRSISAEIAGFFRSGDSVLISLSGGPDSVALLRALVEISASKNLVLSACYINHLLRPVEAEEESRFCENLCDQFEIPYIYAEIDVSDIAESAKISVEEAGREARHTFLNQLAREDQIDRIALGHHADDNIETILFRIFRGTGPKGLTGIPFKRGKIIRPLLGFSRGELIEYLMFLNQDYCVDTSNLETDYSRNYIRAVVLPAIEERFPQARKSILRLSEIMSETMNDLAPKIESAYKRVVQKSPGGTCLLDLEKFRAQPLWIKRAILRRALSEIKAGLSDIDSATIKRLLSLTEKNSGGMSLPGGASAKVDQGILCIFSRRGTILRSRTVNIGQKIELDEISRAFSAKEIPARKARLTRQKKGLKAHLDLTKISGKLTIRSMRPGDTFRPLGMKGTKKLGDFFTDRKIPSCLRNEIPLLCDQIGIIWVAGHEISDRVKIQRSRTPQRKSSAELENILEVEIVRAKQGDSGSSQD